MTFSQLYWLLQADFMSYTVHRPVVWVFSEVAALTVAITNRDKQVASYEISVYILKLT